MSQNKFQAFQGFQGAIGTLCITCLTDTCVIHMFYTNNTCVENAPILHMQFYTCNTYVGYTPVYSITCVKDVLPVFYKCITGV